MGADYDGIRALAGALLLLLRYGAAAREQASGVARGSAVIVGPHRFVARRRERRAARGVGARMEVGFGDRMLALSVCGSGSVSLMRGRAAGQMGLGGVCRSARA